MRQFSADVRRFWARRLVRIALLACVGIALLSIGYTATQGHKPTKAEIAQYNEQVQKLQAQPPTIGPPGDQISGNRVPPEFFIGAPPHDTRLNVQDKLPTKLDGAGQSLLFVAIVLGASFVGAEFSGGSLTSQLLYEPRRWRVYLSKGAAVLLCTVAFSLFFSAFVAIVTYVGASLHGVTSGVDGAWINDRLLQCLRLAAVAGLAAAMAYTVALMTKRTTAAVIIFLAQVPLLFLINPHHGLFKWLSHYSPMRGLMVLATPISASTQDEFLTSIRTHAGAAVLVAVWTIGLGLLAGAVFSRSEVR